jgi:hypothetical protein
MNRVGFDVITMWQRATDVLERFGARAESWDGVERAKRMTEKLQFRKCCNSAKTIIVLPKTKMLLLVYVVIRWRRCLTATLND